VANLAQRRIATGVETAAGDGAWLGLDGGATRTKAVLVRDGAVVWRGEAGPINHLMGEAGVRRMRGALGDLFDQLGARAAEVGGVALGMAGGSVPGKAASARAILAELAPGRPAHVTIDLVSAVWGAGGGRDALILLCGTGSAAFGLCRGEVLRVGGYGPEYGDEGSGYAIAVAAIRAGLHAHDGRGPATSLTGALCAQAGVATMPELTQKAYAELWDSGRIAALAPAVAREADAGDALAQAILERAGADLAEHALAVWRRAGGPMRLSRMGGGWNLSPRLWRAAERRLEEGLGRPVAAEAPIADAAQGSVLWALAGAPGAL